MKTLSDHAHAAKLIRQQLKVWGIKASVCSESYAGGSSVSVNMIDQAKEVSEKVEAFVNQFAFGHFDGMNDIYEFTNRRDDIPQVKFTFVRNEASEGRN